MHKLTRDDTTHGEYYYRSSEVDAQPAQEPIGEAHQMYPHTTFTHCVWDARVVPTGTKLYTTPPQREWVGLTQKAYEQELLITALSAIQMLTSSYRKEHGLDGAWDTPLLTGEAACKAINNYLKCL